MGGGVDRSNGYDQVAERFVRTRNPEVGAVIVLEWAQSFLAGASVLDLSCGHGEPVARILAARGCQIFAVDASLRSGEEFRKRFPAAMAEHAAAESEFFKQKFDGIIAWGLLFLLAPETQMLILRKTAKALQSNGKLLFTAPREAVTWKDAIRGHNSVSLGEE